MKRIVLVAGLVAFSGCFDFTGARAQCAAAGACEGEVLPTLVSSTPAANAAQVELATGFTLTFSEPMDRASVTLSLSPAVALVGPTFSDELTASFTTAAPLAPATSYTATVTGQSAKGVALGPTQFTFTTRSAVDLGAPTVVVTPAEGATGVGVDTSLILVFSEAMNPASLTVTTQPPVDWGAVTWAAQDTQARFEMRAVSLLGSTGYTVVISATDVGGNALAASSATVHFTTTSAPDTAPPTVVATQPDTGASGVAVDSAITIGFSETMQRTTAGVLSITPAVPCTPTFDTTNTVLTCQPAAANKFSYSTDYTVTVTGAKDTAGNGMTAPYAFTFTTAAPPDLTAPTFVSVPAKGAMNVELDAGVVLTFSEPMDQSSVQVVSQAMLAPPSWNAAGTVATFAGTYGPNTLYQVNVSGTDLAGNAINAASSSFGFQTRLPPDTTPPTLIATQPGDQATGVGVTSDLQVTFSEAMDPVSTLTSLSLSPALTALCVLDADLVTLTCKHSAQAFAATTAYAVTLDRAKAKDAAGNALSGPNTFHFTSSAVPDTTRPTIVSVTPGNNSKGLHEDTRFTITFSEPMDLASAQAAFTVATPAAHPPSSFAWSPDKKTLTVIVTGTFPIGGTVNWQVGNTAKDLSNNTLAATQLFSFHVAYQKTQVIEAMKVTPSVRRTNPVRGLSTYSADLSTATVSFVGALGGTTTTSMRGIVAFDLTALDTTFVDAVTASMELFHGITAGSPYAALGDLELERITPSPASNGAEVLFEATPQPIGGCYYLTCFTSITWATANITAASKSIGMGSDVDRVKRAVLTYRLSFTNDAAATSTTRYESFASASHPTTSLHPRVSVTYRYAGP